MPSSRFIVEAGSIRPILERPSAPNPPWANDADEEGVTMPRRRKEEGRGSTPMGAPLTDPAAPCLPGHRIGRPLPLPLHQSSRRKVSRRGLVGATSPSMVGSEGDEHQIRLVLLLGPSPSSLCNGLRDMGLGWIRTCRSSHSSDASDPVGSW
ncbi:hypothetical protein E2562_000092 [Oryza meyeriana var. granulata]|uniref:Uncharacterized protein n=1 Tax=Oryza meyeriana var. granulata TaxID=110450 RepID=A0A6G1DBH9_9ORYZ|nr:hypothetical protein E2562_000092 [Oryza meyeriana var. granulata]